jgi:hypothetical protein
MSRSYLYFGSGFVCESLDEICTNPSKTLVIRRFVVSVEESRVTCSSGRCGISWVFLFSSSPLKFVEEVSLQLHIKPATSQRIIDKDAFLRHRCRLYGDSSPCWRKQPRRLQEELEEGSLPT